MTKLRPDWITDRLPTEADGDTEFDVVVLNDAQTGDWRYVTWDEVQPGWAWHHTDWWRPQ